MNRIKEYVNKATQYYSENSMGTKFLISFLSIFIIGLFKEILIDLFGFWLSLPVVLVLIFLFYLGFSYGIHAMKSRKR